MKGVFSMLKKLNYELISSLLYILIGILFIVFRDQALGFAMTVAGVLFLTVPEIANNYVQLIENLTNFLLIAVDKIDGVLDFANASTIESIIVENSHNILSSAATLAADAVLKLSSITFMLILSWVLSFFMLLYKESWTAGLRRTVTAFLPKKLYAEITDTLSFANRTFGRYLLGSVFDSALVGDEFFLFFVLLVSAFMLILFNVEVKKSLWDVHSSKPTPEKLTTGGLETRTQAETEHCITNVIKALQNMSKNNVGALIVLSKGSLPKQVLQSGVEIDAEISTQMIEGIFFPNAPLHDGAMIIHGHKIQAAGCFLPLTQKTSYPKEYGTRHRAAIGITEVANVISLVVSEETGIISIVKQGNVTRYADYDMLVDALKDYYWQEMPLGDRKRGGLLK